MKASVIIPTKNRPIGLLRAVKSLAPSEQLSIVVVDDGSDVPAADVLSELAHTRIKVVRNGGAAGPAGARNFGVSVADGEIIFFLDDDDQMIDGYIQTVLAAIGGGSAAADYGFSSMRWGDCVEGANGVTGLRGPETPLSKRLAGLGMGFWIRKQIFTQVGGIDETLRVNEDTEFCVRLAAQGVIAWYSAEPGVDIRPQGQGVANELASITSTSRASERRLAFEVILERHKGFLNAYPKEKLSFVRRAAKYAARSGDFWGAIRLAKKYQVRGPQIWMDAAIGAMSRTRTRTRT
jgi:glycosyltransferase involved in cell wall biosynthesis